MPRTTNAAGRIRDESLINLGGRALIRTGKRHCDIFSQITLYVDY
jgi:hypothetical protein